MIEQDVIDALQKAISDECGANAHVERATTALEIPGWDSLAHVRIMMNLEARLGTEIDIDKTYRAATIGDLINLIVSTQGDVDVDR
jgi:acyl carrier protein